MKLHAVLFAVQIIAFASCLVDENLYDFTLNTLKHAFHTANCVYVIKDENSDMHIVEAALMQLNIPTVNIGFAEANLDEFYCYEYVVISEAYPKIKNLFVRNMQREILQFRAHSRTVIFHGGNHSFGSDEVFLLATNFHGLDLITVQGLDSFKVKVKSVRDDSLLASWDYGGRPVFYPSRFERTEWTPNFTIGKTGATFGVSFFHCPPYMYHDANSGVFTGVDYQILRFVARGWPLSFNHLGNDFRSLWLNIVDDLEQGVSNMGLCSLWPITIITKNLSMSLPYTQHCTSFLVPKPHLAEPEDFIFQSNQKKLGLITLVVGLITAVVFTLLARMYQWKIGGNNRYISCTFSLIQAIRIVTSGSPGDPPPRSNYVFRVLITSCCVTALLLSTGYSSGLTTILTYPRFTKIVNTVEDMVEENFSWGGLGNTFRQTAGRSINPFVARLNKNFRNNCTDAQRNEYIRKGENFAIFVKTTPEKFITSVDTLDQYGLRRMKLLKECIEVNLAVLAFNRNSAFPKIFDGYVSKFLEYGFITHWHKNILYNNGLLGYMEGFYSSYPDVERERLPLTIKNLQGAFYLLFSGWCIAFFVLSLEIIWHKYKNWTN